MKLRMIALAGVAATALATPALAGDGWYLGLSGGLADQTGVSYRSVPLPAYNGKIGTDSGGIVALQTGYKFDNDFRLEVESSYSWHDVSKDAPFTGAADLVAQESAPSSGDLTNVYNAAYTILYPYPSKPTIRITSVNYDASSADPTLIGKVAWTCTSKNGTGTLPTPTPTVNGSYALPTPQTPPSGVSVQPMLATGGSVLMVEVAYKYASPTSQVVLGSYNYQDKFYAKPRRVGQLPAPNACP